MKPFFVAWQFLTIFPSPFDKAELDSDDHFKKASHWFPWVGLILGLFCVLIHLILGLFLPIPLVSILVVVSMILMNGGLHLDGLADTVDGMMSSKPTQQILEIMKDSRSGPMGIFAIVSIILIKVIAMTHCHEQIRNFVLLLCPLIGRSSVVFLMNRLPYAQKNGGLASSFLNQSLSKDGRSQFQWKLILNGLGITLLSFMFLRYFGLFSLLFCLLASEFIARICQKKIQGFTGDTLGASCEIIEAFFWVLAASKRMEI